MATMNKADARILRKQRIQKRMRSSVERPRLSVFRSGKHIYAQIINDLDRRTIVAASTLSKDLKSSIKKPSTVEAAKKVGQFLAKKALEQNIKQVCFDRNGYLYHGRVKALADAARAEGLQF
jgi:large subunit ribosomal protein L18